MLSAQQEQGLDAIVTSRLDRVFPAAQITVLVGGAAVYTRAFGFLDPQQRSMPTRMSTRFDLASLSMLFSATAFMTFVDAGQIDLDQPVRDVLPEFSGLRKIAAHPRRDAPSELVEFYPIGSGTVDARKTTFRNLLAHNSGLPAWLPLHIVESDMRAAKRTPDHINYALRDMVTGTMFAYPPGLRLVFSDVGFMLLGFVLERIGRKPLRQVIREQVVDPLEILSVSYGSLPCDDVAPTDYRPDTGAQLCGEVHDQNTAALGGVAGHSGLFGTSNHVARLGEMFRGGGAPLLSLRAVNEMTTRQVEESGQRRGLGFALHSSSEQAGSSPFSDAAFGQLGFTGTSLWVDPARALVVAILTNHAYYGNVNDDSMNSFRLEFHRALTAAIPVRQGPD
jgi:CubicO group peptidase (beta-lactamase class C family)